MAVHKVTIISCNRCGTTALTPTLIILDLVNMVHKAPEGVVDARHRAAAKGWWHTAGGEDLCPEHAPSPRPKAKLLSKIPHPHLRHWGE